MLRSNRLADTLATLIMSCFAILGWMQLHNGHYFQSKTILVKPILAKSIAVKNSDRKVEDVFDLQKLSDR
jgi:hypothetical protein